VRSGGLPAGMKHVHFPPSVRVVAHALFVCVFVFGVFLYLIQRLMVNVEDSIAMDMWCARSLCVHVFCVGFVVDECVFPMLSSSIVVSF